MIQECVHLGYLTPDMVVLDATYGKGRFWNVWKPETLIKSDIEDLPDLDMQADVRNLPFEDGALDCVVIDLPYKENGSGGSHASDEAYGVADSWQGYGARTKMYAGALTEAHRVMKRGGVALVKVMDQVVGGRVSWQTKEIWQFAVSAGFEQIDELLLPNNIRQPERGVCETCGTKLMLRSTGKWLPVGSDSKTCRHTVVLPARQQHARRNFSTLMIFRRL